MANPSAVSAGVDVANFGLALYDRIAGQGSDTAVNDQRWMNDFAWKQALRNEEFQRDLAQNGIKMRVDDAVRAGLHPLVGAGINPASGGFGGAAFQAPSQPSPKQFSNPSFGQNISRALAATATSEEKQIRAIELARAQTQLEGDQIQNEIARRQLKQLGATPPMPPLHIRVRRDDGSEMIINNPDLAAGIMSDPLGAWGTSIKNTAEDVRSSPKWGILPGLVNERLNYRSDTRRKYFEKGRK